MKQFFLVLTLIMMLSIVGFAAGTAQEVVSTMNAQEAVTMADTLRSNGKIYVVLAVVLLIQVGLFVMLWRLDRKLSSLEA
ncbi:MAG: CcmD family protein [Sphingomonadales bacterium]|nr:CcmD family protein [Sphingomonadales bacterium]